MMLLIVIHITKNNGLLFLIFITKKIKKMKKIKSFMIMLLVAMVSLCLTGCTPNPDTPDIGEVSIVGKWECTILQYSSEELGEYEEGEQLFKNDEYIWIFDEDDRMKHYYDGELGGKYDYEVMNNKLYSKFFKDGFETHYATINKLTSNKLSITAKYEADDYDYWIEYTYNFERID